MNAFELLIPGSLHPVESVALQPLTHLTRWQLMKVRHAGGGFSRHLIGWAGYEGRTSSDITAMDVLHLRATSSSGRLYQLGSPGIDSDANWVFERWLHINQCQLHRDQTKALLRRHEMLARSPN